MPTRTMMMKTKWWPRPHDMKVSWMHRLEASTTKHFTILPMCMYDEGLGAPSTYNANNEHTSFAEYGGPNCFVDSRINLILAKLTFSLKKALVVTDGVHAINVCFMPIFTSFEDYGVTDELSSIKIEDVLELTTETTDRQGYPLYNDQKMDEKFANSALLHADMPGLTTTQVLEAVAFDVNSYYDTLNYRTIAGKLKTCQGGLKWMTLTRNKPVKTVKIKLRPKTKRMVPYNFFGVLVGVPKVGQYEQIPTVGETTADVNHVNVDAKVRYYEWQQGFNMEKL